MQKRLGLTAVLVMLAALPARAEKLLAVLPLDDRETNGKLVKAARVSIEEMLRDAASVALGRSGWTVLTNENQLQILLDNNIDPTKCGDQQCHLAAARELNVDLFISGAVQWFDGEFSASIRLLDSKTGRITVALRVTAATAKGLCEAFEARSGAFFQQLELRPPPAPVAIVVQPKPPPVAPAAAPTVGPLYIAVQSKSPATLSLVAPDGTTIRSASPYQNASARLGHWSVTARAEGCQEQTRTFDLRPNEPATMMLELAPLPPPVVARAPEMFLQFSAPPEVPRPRSVPPPPPLVAVATGPRTRGAILSDIGRLERLFTALPKGAPDGRQLARGLSDTYAELERYMQGEASRLLKLGGDSSDPWQEVERDREVEKARHVAERAQMQAEFYRQFFGDR